MLGAGAWAGLGLRSGLGVMSYLGHVRGWFVYSSIAEGGARGGRGGRGGRGATSGLWLGARVYMCSMLTVMLGGDLDVASWSKPGL